MDDGNVTDPGVDSIEAPVEEGKFGKGFMIDSKRAIVGRRMLAGDRDQRQSITIIADRQRVAADDGIERKRCVTPNC